MGVRDYYETIKLNICEVTIRSELLESMKPYLEFVDRNDKDDCYYVPIVDDWKILDKLSNCAAGDYTSNRFSERD